MNAIGKVLGVHGQTVGRWLEKKGISLRYSRPTYAEEVKEEAERLYVEGELSAAAVAERLSLKAHTVKEWLEARGILRSQSEASSLSVANGKPRARASSRLWYVSEKTGENHFAESSLEYLRMQQLDADESVAYWSRCRLRIPYLSVNGKRRHYNPDLVAMTADGGIVIEEMKPENLVDDPNNKAKFAACLRLCFGCGWWFRVVTEDDVGYVRKFAPSALTKEERRARTNEVRRTLWAEQTPEQRAVRLAKNAAYMRKYNARRRESGTNINTTVLTMSAPE